MAADLAAGGDGNVIARFEAEDAAAAAQAAAAAPPVPAPAPVVPAPAPAAAPAPPAIARSDSDFARQLQEQYNKTAAVTGTPLPTIPAAGPAPMVPAPAAGGGSGGKSFTLWHYNGLMRPIHGVVNPPTLARATVCTPAPDFIVGADPHGVKVDDVIRTRFQGAVIEWDTGKAPSIDG